MRVPGGRIYTCICVLASGLFGAAVCIAITFPVTKTHDWRWLPIFPGLAMLCSFIGAILNESETYLASEAEAARDRVSKIEERRRRLAAVKETHLL